MEALADPLPGTIANAPCPPGEFELFLTEIRVAGRAAGLDEIESAKAICGAPPKRQRAILFAALSELRRPSTLPWLQITLIERRLIGQLCDRILDVRLEFADGDLRALTRAAVEIFAAEPRVFPFDFPLR